SPLGSSGARGQEVTSQRTAASVWLRRSPRVAALRVPRAEAHWIIIAISGGAESQASSPRPLALSSWGGPPSAAHCPPPPVSGSLSPYTRLRIIRSHSPPLELPGQGRAFPGLIKARELHFRVIERVQHINMLGQCYQP
ncbi:hypothetical protein KUCAC02_022656, partial [Chaenocephalus aceratus]